MSEGAGQCSNCQQLQGNPVSVDVKDILESCGCGVAAASEFGEWAIYIGQMPQDPDIVIVLYDTGGVRQNTISRCVYENFTFTVRTRSTEYLEAYQKAQEVAGALNLVQKIVDNEPSFHTTYHDIRQVGLPGVERYDDQDRPIFAMGMAGMREIVPN